MSLFRSSIDGLVPYEPGKPVEAVQRELGLERVVKLGELKQLFGESGYVDAEDRLSVNDQKEQSDAKLAVDAQTPPPIASNNNLPSDPASIAKQNLLDRIRATRASVAGTTGRLTDKK